MVGIHIFIGVEKSGKTENANRKLFFSGRVRERVGAAATELNFCEEKSSVSKSEAFAFRATLPHLRPKTLASTRWLAGDTYAWHFPFSVACTVLTHIAHAAPIKNRNGFLNFNFNPALFSRSAVSQINYFAPTPKVRLARIRPPSSSRPACDTAAPFSAFRLDHIHNIHIHLHTCMTHPNGGSAYEILLEFCKML